MIRTPKKRLTMLNRDSTKGKLIINRQSFQSQILKGNNQEEKSRKQKSKFQQQSSRGSQMTTNIMNKQNETHGYKTKEVERSHSIKLNHQTSLPSRQKQNRTLSGFFPNLGNGNRRLSNEEKDNPLIIKKLKKQQSEVHSDEEQKIIEFLSSKIIKELAVKFYISQNSKGSYSIKIDRLNTLVAYLIDVMTTNNTKKTSSLYPQLYFLECLLSKIDKLKKHRQIQDALVFDPDGYDYNSEVLKLKQAIDRRKAAQEELSTMPTHKQMKELQQKHYKTQLQMFKAEEIFKQLSAKKESIEIFLRQINDGSAISPDVYRKIKNYNFKEENRDNYFKKCRQYKQTQSYILDYANYLQNNKIQISADYDSSSFKVAFLPLEEKMIQINDILENKWELNSNNLKIKYFIQDLVELFRKQDGQMSKLCNLKTHCIRSFVRNIKMWLRNWEFKQDVLTNLKQLFVVSAVKIHKKMDDLNYTLRSMEVCEGVDKAKTQLRQIQSVFEEMTQYFKMGNAFY